MHCKDIRESPGGLFKVLPRVSCKHWQKHGNFENDCLLGCCAASHRNVLTFRMCLPPPSSGGYDENSTYETSVNFYKTTRRNFSEIRHLYTRRRENLKCHQGKPVYTAGLRHEIRIRALLNMKQACQQTYSDCRSSKDWLTCPMTGLTCSVDYTVK
jgi:hypothetical protein